MRMSHCTYRRHIGNITPLIILALSTAYSSAYAHTGVHTYGLQEATPLASSASAQAVLAGLWHAISGWDHWSAAFLVGLWSGLTLPRRQTWLGPLSFCGLVAAGAWLALTFGVNSTLSSWIEPMILASLVALTSMVALRARLGLSAMSIGLGTFGLWHGLAHGLELSALNGAGSLVAGVLLGTAAVHLIGAMLGQGFQRQHERISGKR